MAEYIDREKLRELLLNLEKDLIKENGYYDIFAKGFGDCVWQVENFPAADVVEVVRCKDCKHSKYKPIIGRLEEGEQTALLYCTMFVNGQHIYGDDFCSYGERKEDR